MSVYEQELFQRRVLAVARRLRLRGDDLTAEQVDGAFYWTIVQQERVDRIFGITDETAPEDAVDRLLGEPVPPHRLLSALRRSREDPSSEPDDVMLAFHERTSAFREFFRTDDTYLPLFADVQADLPMLMNWIAYGDIPTLRTPWIAVNGSSLAATWNRPENQRRVTEESITIYIPDSRFDGSRVEKFIERQWERWRHPDDTAAFWEHPSASLHEHLFGIGSWLNLGSGLEPRGLPPSTDAFPIPSQPIRFPFVELHIKSPRTARGLIKCYYDDIVRRQGWHRQLRGRTNNQDALSAIRGWGVGLLSNTCPNVTRNRAYEAIAKATRTEQMDMKSFSGHLDPILERVPEVEDVIGLKPSWKRGRLQ